MHSLNYNYVKLPAESEHVLQPSLPEKPDVS